MERNLQLLGTTGINDELQDDLEDTLDYFIKTGIKVWVLTGDKFDTAKSIAFSCKLITQDFKIFEFEEFLNEKKISVYLDNFLYYLNEFYDYKQNLFSRNDIENSLDSNLRDKLNKSNCMEVENKNKLQNIEDNKYNLSKDRKFSIIIGSDQIKIIMSNKNLQEKVKKKFKIYHKK